MKTFNDRCAQGDVMFIRVHALPLGLVKINPIDGVIIITHSESGHNHIVKERQGVAYYASNDPMISYLEVIEATDQAEVLLEHLRSFDTHETIKINPGIYEIRRQRERAPEGWRKIED